MSRKRVGALAIATLGWLAAGAGAATITVTSAADTHTDGQCTLREALVAANTNTASGSTPGDCVAGDAGADTIQFAILPAGLHTIQPGVELPAITEPLTIDGYTQPASGGGTARPNTLAAGSDALLLIELDGSGLDPKTFSGGLIKVAAGPTLMTGLVINRAPGSDGVGIQLTAGGNTVAGNFIGTDPTGTLPRGNGCNGVRVFSSGNTIGGSSPAARNVIASTGGCAINLILLGNDNRVQGNFIGTDATGTQALGGIGVDVVGTGNLVGGTTRAQQNLISGNGSGGVRIYGAGTSGNTLEGNLIGIDATGSAPLPNLYGIAVLDGAHDNTIGGDSAAAGNAIASNTGAGIKLASDAGSGNAILSNPIFGNGGLGIDLGADGVTLNDADDADTGPNGLQNFPVLTSVTASSVEGTLTGAPNTNFTLQFFANTTCDPTGFGEAQTLIGFAAVTTNAAGHAAFGTSLTVPPGQGLTATATDASGSTSELSPCVLLTPVALGVDAAPGAASDGNGVLEPGETVGVEPSWSNLTDTGVTATGPASAYAGRGGPTYVLAADAANYSAIGPGATGSCAITSSCYAASVSSPPSRPATHWDSWFTETLDIPTAPKIWVLHIGESFSDVPRSHPFYRKIETVLHHGITVGCSGVEYCPSQKVLRDQMAIFLARAIARGGPNIPATGTLGATPYDCTPGGVSLFSDVAPTDAACKSVHYIASQNVTTGCAPSLYCPGTTVTRAEMSIFVARAIVAPGGGAAVPVSYGPDPVTGASYSCSAGSPSLHFSDVSVSDTFCKHAHFLWARGVIAGCSASQYCPSGQVGRDEMAKFLSNAFDLKLYGP
jgi:CSLREA domain-containing protein